MTQQAHWPFRKAICWVRASQGFFCSILLAMNFSLAGCAALWEPLKWESVKSADAENRTAPFARGSALFAQRRYPEAFKENQRLLSEGRGAPDVALFNMGLISAYSLNPHKDYPTALALFKKVVRDYPQSALTEQAKVWIEVLEEHQKIVDEKEKLVEEKRALTRERELLSQEKGKLQNMVEKSRQVDIEIEKRRRQTKTP